MKLAASDVISPYLFLGLVIGFAPLAVIHTAVQSHIRDAATDQSQHSADERSRHRRHIRYTDEELSDYIYQRADNELTSHQAVDDDTQRRRLVGEIETPQRQSVTAAFDDSIESSLFDLEIKKNLYVGVLGTQAGAADAMSTIAMTWGKDANKVQMYLSSPEKGEGRNNQNNSPTEFVQLTGTIQYLYFSALRISVCLAFVCNNIATCKFC